MEENVEYIKNLNSFFLSLLIKDLYWLMLDLKVQKSEKLEKSQKIADFLCCLMAVVIFQ